MGDGAQMELIATLISMSDPGNRPLMACCRGYRCEHSSWPVSSSDLSLVSVERLSRHKVEVSGSEDRLFILGGTDSTLKLNKVLSKAANQLRTDVNRGKDQTQKTHCAKTE